MGKILITCYSNPDLDGFACINAYSEYISKKGEDAIPAYFGYLQEEIKYLLNTYQIAAPEKVVAKDFEEIILVDSSDTDGIDSEIDPDKVVEIIDHRKINQAHAFSNAKVQIEFVGAAATLIAEKFMEDDMEISEDSALLLYGAIVSNTLNFKANVTTERDIEAANWLKDKLDIPDDFAEKMFRAKSDMSGERLLNAIEGDFANFKSHNFGGKRFGIAQIEIVDGLEVVEKRKSEILKKLEEIKKKEEIDFNFLTIIDLLSDRNIIVTSDKATQGFLEEALDINFNGNIAVRPGFIMRKEIVPLIKEQLEKSD